MYVVISINHDSHEGGNSGEGGGGPADGKANDKSNTQDGSRVNVAPQTHSGPTGPPPKSLFTRRRLRAPVWARSLSTIFYFFDFIQTLNDADFVGFGFEFEFGFFFVFNFILFDRVTIIRFINFSSSVCFNFILSRIIKTNQIMDCVCHLYFILFVCVLFSKF
jgi:hypothetical protein